MSLSDYMTKCTQTASSHRHFKLPEVKFISISDPHLWPTCCVHLIVLFSDVVSLAPFLRWETRLLLIGGPALRVRWVLISLIVSEHFSLTRLPETPFLSSHGGVGGNQLHIGFFQPSLLKSSSFLQASESNFPQLFEVRISQGWLSTAPQWEQPGPSQLSAGDKDPLSRRRLCRLICPAPLGNGAAVWLWSAWDSGQ